MKIYAAPLQGHTQAAWRRHHAAVFGGIDTYYSPFMRVEKGEVRRRDRADIAPENNPGVALTPQCLFRDAAEFSLLAEAAASGNGALDLNLGCPFPPQTRHGRGAALLQKPAVLKEVADIAAGEFPGLRLSAKIRLGMERPDEWLGIIDTLNAMPLERVAVHPRVARQQYGGEPHMEEFGRFLAASAHPVVLNGDLRSTADMTAAAERYPQLDGLMVGRGLLARPSLGAEWRSGTAMDEEELRRRVLALHDAILADYTETLCGDAQILSKIKPFWEFQEPDALFPRRFLKQLHKATTLAKYQAAMNV
ncbi:MAG: tRNA-dihydrouridine synthase family protein [Muribaculaceae bacterium]|nr:tRNA-dihydrouridine synthase family protein [Muribaculaceae bacterium]